MTSERNEREDGEVRESRLPADSDTDEQAKNPAPDRASAGAIAAAAVSPEGAPEISDAPEERADEHLAAGRYAEAAEAFAGLAAADPNNVRAAMGLGAAQLYLGRYDAAEKEFRRALRLAPELPDVHYHLGLTLFKRGVNAAASAELRRATELDPEHAAAFQVLGEALNQMGEPQEAIRALEQAVRLSPENSKAYYAMGIAHDRLGNPERAGEMYRRSREVGAR